GLFPLPVAPSPRGDPGSISRGAKGHRGERRGRSQGGQLANHSLCLSTRLLGRHSVLHLGPRRLGSLPGSERGVGAGGLEQGGLGARTPGFSPRLWEGSRGWWVRAGGGQDPGDANSPPPISPADEGDMTEIWWQPFLQQGRVLFHDPTFTMGQVLWRASPGGPGQILLRCVQSMPREPEQAYNSCYSGGVFQLQRGDQLSLRVPRANASLDLSPHGTFLGLVRL
uniref:THD domain-containing protein n=1 Tax=Chelydra serpentina TaxID=8475 RepID=A0A8C3XM70_CHESE